MATNSRFLWLLMACMAVAGVVAVASTTSSASSDKAENASANGAYSNVDKTTFYVGDKNMPTFTNTTINTTATLVPFIVLQDPSWRDLSVMLEKYRREASELLKGLSRSLELALHSERQIFSYRTTHDSDNDRSSARMFSDRIHHHIERVSECLDHNERVLIEMLQPFKVTFALPSSRLERRDDVVAGDSDDSIVAPDNGPSTTTLFTMKGPSYNEPVASPNGYDCGAQVVAHIVRDWTVLGQSVRATIYDWCRTTLQRYYPATIKTKPVLVPGSGLGRLAYDLAAINEYAVEANEVSLSMAAGAQAMLDRRFEGTVYPFAMDFFANEVISDRRYDLVSFPDVPVILRHHRGSKDNTTNHDRFQQSTPRLSYTIGDFVTTYRFRRVSGSFGALITCFFLDTATNILEYLATIEHALEPGGIWINVGPLRWHRNSMLHPSVDELRHLVEHLFSFDVLHWQIDQKPSEYRHEEDLDSDFVRSTAYDAYRPLRFVARKRRP